MQRLLSAIALLVTVSAAHAAPLKPNSGLWWEEPVTGRFFAVEIAPSGRTFVVISEFDEQGRPSWRTMRGELTLANELEQIRLCDCGVQSWDLLQSISNLLAKAEQKQWLSQKEQQRVMDWLAAAICQ